MTGVPLPGSWTPSFSSGDPVRILKEGVNAAYRRLTSFAAGKRERGRYSADGAGEPRVFYGHEKVPGVSEQASGGIVKLQDLQGDFPNHPEGANILYLVSSALPVHGAVMVKSCREAGGKVVLNQNGVAYPAWHGAGWRQANKVLSLVHEGADHVFYQSRFCRMSAEQFLGPRGGTAEILYNAIDTGTFAPAAESELRQGLVLLLSGSHNFFYRIRVAMEVLAILRLQRENVRMVIAGRCCWRSTEEASLAEARACAREKGVLEHIRFAGAYSQKSAPGIYREAHVLLHPQYNDCCPRVVLEALSCGLPVVYSASGGVPELVGEEGGRGVTAPLDWEQVHPPDPEALAEAVLDVRDRYAACSEAARTRALQLFGIGGWKKRHAEVFRRLTGSVSGG